MRARGLTNEHPDVVAASRTVAALRERGGGGGGGGAGSAPNPAYSSLQAMQVERQSNVMSAAIARCRPALGNRLDQRQCRARTGGCCRSDADQPRL